MRGRWFAAPLLLLAALSLGGPPVLAQDDAPPNPQEAIAATIEGPWFGRIQGLERADRYLEVLAVEPSPTGLSGVFRAGALFGWADGPISPTPAEIVVDAKGVAFTLTATTGAKLSLRFDGAGAQGTYQPVKQPPRRVEFARVNDRSDYDWLGGVWIAHRKGQTRVFDVKRVVASPDGKILAIGQYGIAEETGRIRQMVATVDGDPEIARIRWRTANTVAELKRAKGAPAFLGSFEVRDQAARADTIMFVQTGAGPASPGRQTVDVGKPFPDIVLVTLDGDKVRIRDYRGKTLLVTFFQSWDVWSTDEMKAFRAAEKRFGDKLAVLAINYRALRNDVSPLANTVRPLPPKVDISDVGKAIEVKRIPSIWIIDGKGIVIERVSYLPKHSLLALLDQLVK